jgi:hypothetical protein
MSRALASTTASLLAIVAGCGPSAATVTRAKDVAYQADFAVVWNAVVAAVRRDYPDIAAEDATKGVIVTQWHPVGERTSDEIEDQGGSGSSGSGGAGTTGIPGQPRIKGAQVFRVRVNVKRGGPPWQVSVEGEAARYEPGMTMLMPYQRDAIDEPKWVQPRIDRLYVAIYEQLEKYAVDVGTPADRKVGKKTFDTTPWANLPPEARDLVGAVRAAAARKDAAAMRGFLTDPFASSVGTVPADQTAAVWSADPAELETLTGLLDQGCEADAAGASVTCPKGAQSGMRAIFRRVGGSWRLAQLSE